MRNYFCIERWTLVVLLGLRHRGWRHEAVRGVLSGVVLVLLLVVEFLGEVNAIRAQGFNDT